MKKYIFIIISFFFLWLWFIRIQDIPLSSKSPFDNSIRVQVQAVGVINIMPVIVLHKSNGLEEVCRVEPKVTYDCVHDVDDDFKSITWLSEEKFEIRVSTNGRIHRMLGKEVFVYDVECK